MSHDQAQPTPPKLLRANTIFNLVLVTAVAAFVLAFAVKVGYDLIAALQPEQAEAAPDRTATPAVTTQLENAAASPDEETASPPPTATSTAAIEGATPTITPQPTATLPPTATPQPTPIPPILVPPSPRLVAGSNGVNVRRGPRTDYEKIGLLEPGTEAKVTARYGEWWRVDYEEQTGYISGAFVTAFDIDDVPEIAVNDLPGPTLTNPLFEPAPIWAINEERWIDVDLSEQRVTAYEGQTPVQTYLVSTGLPATPTPEGQFRIWVKFRYDDMEGEDYFLEDVPFVMYFHEGYGFHGVWWHANWGNPMSHGCVNQPNDMAEWLFNFADVGTLVNIHE